MLKLELNGFAHTQKAMKRKPNPFYAVWAAYARLILCPPNLDRFEQAIEAPVDLTKMEQIEKRGNLGNQNKEK